MELTKTAIEQRFEYLDERTETLEKRIKVLEVLHKQRIEKMFQEQNRLDMEYSIKLARLKKEYNRK